MEKPNNNPVKKHRNTPAQECSVSAVQRRGSLELTIETTPKSVKLCFNKELPEALTNHLSEIGFKQVPYHPLKWYAPKHPAFVNYANALAKAIQKGEDALSVLMHPSFTSSEEHINLRKFSYIILHYKKGESKKQDHYIIFDSYKTVATHIATRFGKTTHKTNFIGVGVHPRTYIKKARTLLKEKKVIGSITSPELKPNKTPAITDNPAEEKHLPSEVSPLEATKYKGLKLFTAKEALNKPVTVIELQSRWYDAYEHFENTCEKPALEQIQKCKNVLNAIKGRDKTSVSQRKTLKQKIADKTAVVNTVKTLIEGENINFQQELLQYAVERAETLGYTIDNEDTITDFSVDISEALFNERMIEPYYNDPVPKVIDTLIHSFFKETNAPDPVIPKGDTPKQENNSSDTSSASSLDNIPHRGIIGGLGLDYIDLVIAHLYEKYANGERPTKKQIEDLATELNIPNLGMLWEAAELSWLLWYKQIYAEKLPFALRLEKMIRFWNQQQPTYTYSDSSKEIYKQYSTPCPISAMVAQYTQMDTAKTIFEPSAGNGLLLLGADPRSTHVNEIDPTRLASLRFQGFEKITNDNAITPFPENMTKSYDVMVTNPPFSRWEEEKFDKAYIIQKYFNNHIGLSANIRLEHLMAGLALHTLKDNGKAAIIIMGHLYFAADGFIAKYRPFFNWLYRHYRVDDVINMNSFKLYNKQGAVARTMLILINGRKPIPKGVAPQQYQAPYLDTIVDSFEQLWQRIKSHIGYNINTIINQLQIALTV